MVRIFQKLNPSNARITIDYKKNDVDMSYVHNEPAIKICFQTFLYPILRLNLYLFYISTLIYLLTQYPWNETKTFMVTNVILLFIAFVGGAYLSTFIVSILFSINKELLKLMPEMNYKLARRKPTIAEFLSRNVKNKKVEIPLFRNIGLDYEATEEFSKYLTRVEIREHEFNNIINGKKKVNPYLWKATFYFEEKPKSGKLEVRFK